MRAVVYQEGTSGRRVNALGALRTDGDQPRLVFRTTTEKITTDLLLEFLRTQVAPGGPDSLTTPTSTRHRRRAEPLPAMCIAPPRLHRMRQAVVHGALEPGSYVFATRTGRPVEPRNLYRSFVRVAKAASLRPVRLHDARHGCATLLTAAGVAPRVVTEILGHSQISITTDVYTQREAISLMGRLLKRRIHRS